ncbi:MAG: polyprenyl synthetase family protein [Oligoflexales bacterium]
MSISSLRDFFEFHWGDFITTHYGDSGHLSAACQYALEGSGKRARPLLFMMFAQSLGQDLSKHQLFIPAFALEMIHTYSLVHDDLPIFDDDDLRRGRPTVHVKYDDATALLVGDALLSDAWALLSGGLCQEDLCSLELSKRMQMIQVLSFAVGSRGMVQGQMLDLIWTNKQGYEVADLNQLHQRKTGDLIAAACKMGSIAAGANKEQSRLAALFGSKIGLAFQVIDDLLDGRSGTGKSPGKDKEQGKLTFLQTMNYEQAQAFAQQLTNDAMELLYRWPGDHEVLKHFAQSLLHRTF